MQTRYGNQFEVCVPGQPVDARLSVVEGRPSSDANALSFGTGLVWTLLAALVGAVRAPRLNQGVATLSTDLIAANSTIVTVNGVSTTATVYASSHAATMAAILVKVQALSTVTSASTTGDTLTVKTGDADTVLTVAVTLGSSQPTVTYAYTTYDTYAGLAQFEQKEGSLESISSAVNEGGTGASGGVGFLTTEQVPLVRMGLHWVPVVVSSAIANGTVAYIITAATNRGKFTDASSGNIKAGVFRSGTTTLADGTVVAQIQTDAPALNS